MPAASRITDKMEGHVGHHNAHNCPAWCSGHDVQGGQTTGRNKFFINGKQAAALGDSGYSTCPCCGAGYTNSSASAVLFIQGKPIARIGDNVNIHNQGSGKMVTGSHNFFVAR